MFKVHQYSCTRGPLSSKLGSNALAASSETATGWGIQDDNHADDEAKAFFPRHRYVTATTASQGEKPASTHRVLRTATGSSEKASARTFLRSLEKASARFSSRSSEKARTKLSTRPSEKASTKLSTRSSKEARPKLSTCPSEKESNEQRAGGPGQAFEPNGGDAPVCLRCHVCSTCVELGPPLIAQKGRVCEAPFQAQVSSYKVKGLPV